MKDHEMRPRMNVEIKAGDLKVGDGFRHGWIVKALAIRNGLVSVKTGRQGGGRPAFSRYPVEQTLVVTRPDPYIRQRTISEETGAEIEVLDLSVEDSEFRMEGTPQYGPDNTRLPDADADRWATTCRTHSTICTHSTLRLAISHAASPSGWCEDCADALEG